LRVPWTAKRSNQSILKEIGPEYSLEGLMLELKNDTSEIIYKTEIDSENKVMVTSWGVLVWRADWEFGIYMYTLPYLK